MGTTAVFSTTLAPSHEWTLLASWYSDSLQMVATNRAGQYVSTGASAGVFEGNNPARRASAAIELSIPFQTSNTASRWELTLTCNDSHRFQFSDPRCTSMS